MKVLCIYHAKCIDGFTAAFVVHTAFLSWKEYDELTFLAANYDDPLPPDIAEYDHVIIVDFSYKYADMLNIAAEVNYVTVLDHHKSARLELCDPDRKLPGNVTCVFKMDKSGALLAWEHFFPGIEVPSLVQMVSDRDLWKFEFSETKALHQYLCSLDRTFENWNQVMNDLEFPDSRESIINQGNTLLRKYMKDINELIDNGMFFASFTKDFPRIPYLDCPGLWASDAGHIMCNENPDCPFSVIFRRVGTKIFFSLRSNDYDVSELARAFGGGGHKNAAGFVLTVDREVIEVVEDEAD